MEQYEKIYLYKRLVQAKLFIDRCFAENINIDQIADEACFSKFHFIRLFKSIYGKTPHNYLIKVRIDHARLLLKEGKTVIDASLSVGFDSPTAFTAVFKKITGKTPSAFQNEHIAKTHAFTHNPLKAVPNCFAETYGWTK